MYRGIPRFSAIPLQKARRIHENVKHLRVFYLPLQHQQNFFSEKKRLLLPGQYCNEFLFLKNKVPTPIGDTNTKFINDY